MTFLNYALLFAPEKAFFPPIDRGQYIEGVTAVWGADELMNLMKQVAKEKPVLILAEGNFGLVADVLRVYDQPDDNIDILGLWPLNEEHLFEYRSNPEERFVFVVFSHRDEFPDSWPIDLVKEYKKPMSDESLYLFILLPPEMEIVATR
jgi:hypothetical protein